MINFIIPESKDAILLETSLVPAIVGSKQETKGSSVISTFKKQSNKAAVGVPYFEELISRLIETGQKIPHEVEIMSRNYDFHFVSLSCSFLPDKACKFTWARFEVELYARSESGSKCREVPIAYSMFPDEILSEISFERKINFGADLQLSKGLFKVGMGLKDHDTKSIYIVYEPQIFAFGINTSKVAWDFQATKEKSIWGNKKDLFLIIKSPKGSRVTGRFSLSAEVGFFLGKMVRVPLKKKEDHIIETEYDLSNMGGVT